MVHRRAREGQRAAGAGPVGRAEVLADGGAVLGVELQGGVDAPVARDLSADGGQQVGGVAGADGIVLVQGDLLRAEVITLAERDLQAFESAGLLDKTAGDRERQLVGVVDAVAADELVFGEHLRVAEIEQCAVEYRDIFLIAVRREHVKGARLQRLFVILAGKAERTVEIDAGIEAEDRQVAGDALLGRIVVQRVVGAVPADLRGEEAVRVGERQA